jgi:hypothetical protein
MNNITVWRMTDIWHREKAGDFLGSREINRLDMYCAPYRHTAGARNVGNCAFSLADWLGLSYLCLGMTLDKPQQIS